MTAPYATCRTAGCDAPRAGEKRLAYCADCLERRQRCSHVFPNGERCTNRPEKRLRTTPLCTTHYRTTRVPELGRCVEAGCTAARPGPWRDRCEVHEADRARCAAVDDEQRCPNVAQVAGLCARHYGLTRPGTCKTDGCDGPLHARGLCAPHYRREYDAAQPPCKRPGCDRLSDTAGLCFVHYVPPKYAGVACVECGAQARKTVAAGPVCTNCGMTYFRHRRAVFDRHGGLCGICGEAVSYRDRGGKAFAIDHVIPQALGGSHDLPNLQPTHPSCNSAKHDDLGVWRHLTCGRLVEPAATSTRPAWNAGVLPVHVGCDA